MCSPADQKNPFSSEGWSQNLLSPNTVSQLCRFGVSLRSKYCFKGSCTLTRVSMCIVFFFRIRGRENPSQIWMHYWQFPLKKIMSGPLKIFKVQCLRFREMQWHLEERIANCNQLKRLLLLEFLKCSLFRRFLMRVKLPAEVSSSPKLMDQVI